MVKSDFNRVLDEVEFDYGTHTVNVKISVEQVSYGFQDSFEGYHKSGERFVRTVHVFASQEDIEEEDESTVEKETKCEILTDSVEPNFSVPDDPSIGFFKRALARFSDEHTVESLKEQKRDRLKKNWQETYQPKGPLIELSTQIEKTARPVLEQLDEYYFVLDTDYGLGVDETIEKLEAEVSVADIDIEVLDTV